MNNRKTTQNEQILQHIEKYGYSTPREAYELYSCMRLAARISDLKSKGFPIYSERVVLKDRDGGVVQFNKYMLAREAQPQ